MNREALKNTSDQIDLTDIYKTLHPQTAKYTFLNAMAHPPELATCWATKKISIN